MLSPSSFDATNNIEVDSSLGELPVTDCGSHPHRLLIVDSRVEDTAVLINSAQKNVHCIIVDFANDTFDGVLAKIRDTACHRFVSAGWVSHSYSGESTQFLGTQQKQMVVENVVETDSDIGSWSELMAFFSTLHMEYGVECVHMISCDLGCKSEYVYAFGKLEQQIGVRFHLAEGKVGNAEMGGSWTIDGVSMIDEGYFTKDVEQYGHVLADYVHQTQQEQTVYFDKIRIDDATGGAGYLEAIEIQVWINGSNVAKTATIEAYEHVSYSLNDSSGKCKLNNDKIPLWFHNGGDMYRSKLVQARYINMTFSSQLEYNKLDAIVLLNYNGINLFNHKVELYNGNTLLTNVNLYSLTSNNTSDDRKFGSAHKGIVKLRGPNHVDTAQMRGHYYRSGSDYYTTTTSHTNTDNIAYYEPTGIIYTAEVVDGYTALVSTMVGDADDFTYATDIIYTIPITAVAAYTTVAFDSNNDITIENALPQGDTDAVTFTLATGYEMAGLTLAEFTGSTTSSVNYTLQNTTTDASYNGSFSSTDAGNNVFSPFGVGTYNITFNLSGSEGVTYKLTGTQMLDYAHQYLTIKKFPPVTPLVNLAGPTGNSMYNNWRSGQVLTSSASYGTGTYRVKSLVSHGSGWHLTGNDLIEIFDGDTATTAINVTSYNSTGRMEVEIPTAIQLTKIVFNSNPTPGSPGYYYNLSNSNCVSVKVLPEDTRLAGTFSYDGSTYENTLTVTDTEMVEVILIR